MKRFYLLLGLAVSLLLSACANDPGEVGAAPTGPPEINSHAISAERALQELDAVLSAIDGPATRSTARRVRDISVVDADLLRPATRTDRSDDLDELLYIANFANDEGYAILAADDRLTPVIAVVEQGSLSPDELAAVFHGETSDSSMPPILGNVAAYALGIGGSGGGSGGGTGPRPFVPDIDVDDGSPPGTTRYEYGPWENASKIGPLVPVKWDQDYPYDYYTYYDETHHAAVGCCAVAMGQLMITEFYKQRMHAISIPR